MHDSEAPQGGRWTVVVTQLIAGGVAGTAADIVMHPLDTIKARIQVQKRRSTSGFLQTSEALSRIIRHEGVRSLYRGLGSVVVATAPATALYFLAYEGGKEVFGRFLGAHHSLGHFCAGLVAELVSTLIWVPRDVAKERLQVQALTPQLYQYRGSLDALRTIIKTEGLCSLYRGYWPTLVLWAPYNGLYFAAYERLKRYYTTDQRAPGLPLYVYFGCSAVSSSIAATVTCPIDVVKLRLQVSRRGSGEAGYRHSWDVVRQVWAEEGPQGYWRGLGARLLWLVPRTALIVGSYETLKRWLAAG